MSESPIVECNTATERPAAWDEHGNLILCESRGEGPDMGPEEPGVPAIIPTPVETTESIQLPTPPAYRDELAETGFGTDFMSGLVIVLIGAGIIVTVADWFKRKAGA